ncbi:MAG: hypothetical protein LBR49_06770 [Tannerella sp.]|jgi:hypothetical protein|nr:hypothetical protein [Tannerella sp.]
METKETVKTTATVRTRKTKRTTGDKKTALSRASMLGLYKGKYWMAEGDIFNLGL